MQTKRQIEAAKQRLIGLIQKERGEFSEASVLWLAKKARVSYTTLARYVLYTGTRSTDRLRRRTLEAVAMALDVNPEWLYDGQGSRQLAVWPILTPGEAECSIPNPDDQVQVVIQQLKRLPLPLRVRAFRAAIAAAIEEVAASGESVGDEPYRCLMRLDAVRRQVARARAAS